MSNAARKLRGIRYLVDDAGDKTAVVIDLRTHAELWEDFYDQALSAARANEPRESLASVKARLARERRRASNG
jgi:hypothetical protein